MGDWSALVARARCTCMARWVYMGSGSSTGSGPFSAFLVPRATPSPSSFIVQVHHILATAMCVDETQIIQSELGACGLWCMSLLRRLLEPLHHLLVEYQFQAPSPLSLSKELHTAILKPPGSSDVF